jgi:hypothetical protein
VTINLEGGWIKLHCTILTDLKKNNGNYSKNSMVLILLALKYRSGQSQRTVASVAVPSHKYLPNHLRKQHIVNILNQHLAS